MSLLVGPAMGPGHRKSRDVQSGNHSTTLGNLHEGIPLIGFMSNFVVLGFFSVPRRGRCGGRGMGCYPRRVNPDFEETAVCGCLLCGKLSAADETEEFLLRDSDKCPQGPRRPFPSDEHADETVFQSFKRNNQAATSNNAAWRADRDRAGAGHPEIDPHRPDGRSLPCPSHTSCTCDTERETQCRAREDESSVFLL